MKSKTLALLLKIVVILAFVCGLFIFLIEIPALGQSFICVCPDLQNWYWPWLIFAWLYSLPCFAVLIEVWCVSNYVKNETVFTLKTARVVKSGAVLLLADAAFLFIGNAALLLLNMSHPGVFILFAIAVVFECAAALSAAILSRYLTKASALQEESDGTL